MADAAIGGKTAVETLAGGHSAVAPVARMALERLEPAARDDVSGKLPVREVTVNRAFSRRFFRNASSQRGTPRPMRTSTGASTCGGAPGA